MKCISLYQPWASLWLTPAKTIETRPRAYRHRGWTLVHATKHLETDVYPGLDDICRERLSARWRLDLPRGAIIGAVNIVDCRTTAFYALKMSDESGGIGGMVMQEEYQCGNYERGRFGIQRADVKRFTAPIPYRGMQAVGFEVPDHVVAAAMGAAQ